LIHIQNNSSKGNGFVPLLFSIISPSLVTVGLRQMLQHVKCPIHLVGTDTFIHHKWQYNVKEKRKVILDPHPESDHDPNLITCRGSSLATLRGFVNITKFNAFASYLAPCGLTDTRMHRNKQELSYRQQITCQVCTQYAEGIYRDKYCTVTLKSRLRVTQGHWKRNHWIDHTRLSSSRVIGR